MPLYSIKSDSILPWKKGRLEIADKGTLFINEIGELPFAIQVKLLRAIQEKPFNRVGGTKTLHSVFRMIAATNLNLLQFAKKHNRKNLYIDSETESHSKDISMAR